MLRTPSSRQNWWKFEVVLIAESDTSLAAFAKKLFPKAIVMKIVRDIADLVRSGKLHLTADVGMPSFPCQSQSILQDLNSYPDLTNADLFRSDLRFEIMDSLKME